LGSIQGRSDCIDSGRAQVTRAPLPSSNSVGYANALAADKAMAAVSCTSLPVHSTVAASQVSSQHVECSGGAAAPQLGAVSSRRRIWASSAGRLSCAASLGGSSLGLELRQSSRRREWGVVSTRCESSSEEGAPEKVQCWSSLALFIAWFQKTGFILFSCLTLVREQCRITFKEQFW
jgi:hypothetical protein